MEAVSDDKASFQLPTWSILRLSTIPYCLEVRRSPPPKAIRVVLQAPSTSPSFSPSAPQVEPFEPEIEIVVRYNVKRPLLFAETGVADMQDNKPGPFTQSSARARALCPTPRTTSALTPAESVWGHMELPRHQLHLPFFSRHQPYLLLRTRTLHHLLPRRSLDLFVPPQFCLPLVPKFASS